jgi:hypothetical protein
LNAHLGHWLISPVNQSAEASIVKLRLFHRRPFAAKKLNRYAIHTKFAIGIETLIFIVSCEARIVLSRSNRFAANSATTLRISAAGFPA